MATPIPSPLPTLVAATPAPTPVPWSTLAATSPVKAADLPTAVPAALPTPASLSLGTTMSTSAEQVRTMLPELLQALAVLLIGWLLAVVLARTTRRVLGRAGLDERMARFAGLQADGQPRPVSAWLGQAVFYLILLFTLTAFFSVAGLETLAAPLTAITNSLVAMLPNLLSALVLIIVAWLVATAVRVAVERGAAAAKLDSRLAQAPEDGPVGDQMGVAESLAIGAQALVYLLFLIPILNLLGLSALAEPMQDLLGRIVAFIPNLVSAAAIGLATWFMARLVVLIVAGLSSAAGVDEWGRRFGVTDVRLSKVLAAVASAIVIIPGTVIAVNALGIAAISDPLNDMMNQAVAMIPAYVAAGAVLVVAWVFGRILAGITKTVVAGLGFDRLPRRLGFAADDFGGQHVSDLAGKLLLVTILLLAASKASEMVGLASLTAAIHQIWNVGLRLLLALAIAVVGIYLANLTYAIAMGAMGANRRPLAVLLRLAVLIFAFAIALSQIGVGESIVVAAFGALVFGLAAAAALAFGLGGRELAGRVLEREYARLEEEPAAGKPPSGEAAAGDDHRA